MKDPEERRDLSNDPRYRDVIKSGLEKIFARWSADDMLKQAERQARARGAHRALWTQPYPPRYPPILTRHRRR